MPFQSYGHKDSQFWFAFSFQGKSYTFTRVPQGYVESPSFFNAALKDNLSNFVFPGNSALLQYVDDLLVCSPDQDTCTSDTLALLHFLAQGVKR